MKRKLEEKIINKVYKLEAKRTFLEVFFKILGVIILLLVIFITSKIIFEIFVEEKTFSLLEIFQENIEVIKKYFFDTVFVFYQETPKLLVLLLIVSFIVLLILLLTIIKNFDKIRNKLKSIYKHWLSH